MTKKKQKDLVDVIKANPGCIAVIDNDCWWIRAKDSDEDDEPLISSDDPQVIRDYSYGPDSNYGQGILCALADIVGIEIESV